MRFTAHSRTRTSERILFAGRLFAFAIARYLLRSALRYVRVLRGSPASGWSLSIIESCFSRALFSSERSCGWRMFEGEHNASRIIVPRLPSGDGFPSLLPACSGVGFASFSNVSLTATRKSIPKRLRSSGRTPRLNGHLVW